MRRSRIATDLAETDGRLLRSARSRERILDALTELVRGGDLQPTGQQVAERAGVSLRTVFRHFEDLESLYHEMRERVERLLRPSAELLQLEGELGDRVRSLVQVRAGVFERGTPFLRSGAVVRWRSRFLRDAHAGVVRELRQNLCEVIPEVEELDGPRREAVELVTSFEAWDRLRSDQRLGRERAEAVVVETLLTLLEAE